MIITVAGFKGGVGKTTTAVHLACYFAEHSKKVLLVDGDPNRSASGWGKRGNLPFEVCDLIAAARKSAGQDHIVIDTEAHPDQKQLDALADGCDVLLLPTTADALAIDALLKTVRSLKEIDHALVLLTMVDSRKKTTAEAARDALTQRGLTVCKQSIRRLTAYEKAALLGVPVYDAGDRFSNIAWSEYRALGKEVEAHA